MTKTPTVSQQEQVGRTTQGRFAKGHVQNPKGRTPGSRNKATAAAQTLLDGEAEALTRKAIELALEGDTVALRLCLERLVPPRRERALEPIELPNIQSFADLPQVTAAILTAAAQGHILPSEATALTNLVSSHGKALELADLETRLTALESKVKDGK